jgi:hypothetical protein
MRKRVPAANASLQDADPLGLSETTIGPPLVFKESWEVDVYVFELGAGYRAWEKEYGPVRSDGFRSLVGVDVLAGARYWNVTGDLKVIAPPQPVHVHDDEQWVDPFVGAVDGAARLT